MSMPVAAAVVLSATVIGAQVRGRISTVTASGADSTGIVQLVVHGSNPCGTVHVDYGDGTAETHAIRELPATIPHEYLRTGDFIVRASGMEGCIGDARTRVAVSRIRAERRNTVEPWRPFPDIRPTWVPVWTERQFRELDRDADNEVSRNEWRGDLPEFQRVDRNHDDWLSRAEFLDGEDTGRGAGRGRGERSTSVIITVSARQAWTDTGFEVRVGDTLSIDAKGKIQFGPNKGDTAGPDGARGNRGAANAPLPRTAMGALIARVGNSAPFDATSKGKPLLEPANGRLYLGINDDDLRDNSGEFLVTVSIKNGKGRGK